MDPLLRHVAFGLPLLRITRRINDEPADRSRLWSGRSVRVAVTADSSGIPAWLQMPWLEIAEVVPRGGVVAGSLAASGLASPDEPLLISYQLTPESPGQVRFDGVAVEAGDAHGFFRWTTVRRRPSLLRVLPTPIDLRGRYGRQAGQRPAQQGMHRYKKAGSGTELLDLRDYQLGDPPKTIAWKLSARRDRLITRDYESEVPVRCTLLLDASDSSRVGTGTGTPLKRLASLAGRRDRQPLVRRPRPGWPGGARRRRCVLAPPGDRPPATGAALNASGRPPPCRRPFATHVRSNTSFRRGGLVAPSTPTCSIRGSTPRPRW